MPIIVQGRFKEDGPVENGVAGVTELCHRGRVRQYRQFHFKLGHVYFGGMGEDEGLDCGRVRLQQLHKILNIISPRPTTANEKRFRIQHVRMLRQNSHNSASRLAPINKWANIQASSARRYCT